MKLFKATLIHQTNLKESNGHMNFNGNHDTNTVFVKYEQF